MPIPTVLSHARPPRMRRSGPMSLHWRNSSDEHGLGTVRISPEILSAFNKAIGALGGIPGKQPAHALAYK